MKTFKDLVFNTHPIGDGVQAKLFFENGYGVSVISFKGSYGYPNSWELAVMIGDEKEPSLCYDTPITDDVLGYLSDDEVSETMRKVQELKPV